MDNMAFRIESDASLDVKCGEETVTTRIEDGARIYTPTESSHTEDSKIDNVVFEPLKIFTIGKTYNYYSLVQFNLKRLFLYALINSAHLYIFHPALLVTNRPHDTETVY